MQAYHNDPHLKDLFIKVLTWHRDQDRIVQGTYWNETDDEAECQVNGINFVSHGRGCAVGCSIESLGRILKRTRLDHRDHGLYEELLGVPQVLAHLEDSIFEGLPIERARVWPVQFAEAIPVGADLSLVWPRFAMWLFGDPNNGVIRFVRTGEQRQIIQNVVDAYGRFIVGQPPTAEEWRSYRDAAYAYAAAADADAADAAAAYADAADAAAAYAYADAAKKQARTIQADYLLKLLKECAA